jgi:hypothetical protein
MKLPHYQMSQLIYHKKMQSTNQSILLNWQLNRRKLKK